jgi:hypothetical protein
MYCHAAGVKVHAQPGDNIMSLAIHQQIQALHQQLTALPFADSDTQNQLLILQADINRLLADEADMSSENSPTDAVESLAARFDADHPALSNALRSLVDTLGKAGI